MFHTYFFLKRLVSELNEKITGYRLHSCFTQSKNELILVLRKSQDTFYIKASLDPDLSLLSFPQEFHRARRNTTDQFQSLINNEILGVQITPFDRSFSIQFPDDNLLVFKMHGTRSNIIHFEAGNVIEVFRTKIKQDLTLSLDSLSKDISIDNLDITQYEILLNIMGPELRNEFKHRLKADKKIEEDMSVMQSFIKEVEHSPIGIIINRGKPTITLLSDTQEHIRPIQACNELFRRYTTDFLLTRDKESFIRQIEKQLERTNGYIAKTRLKHKELSAKRNQDEIANILMANLDKIPAGSTEVELFDFYKNEPITIKLKSGQRPQKLAESYYRKHKRKNLEIDQLQFSINAKVESRTKLEFLLDKARSVTERKELNKLKTRSKSQIINEPENEPFHSFERDGFRILIGKNAKANDELTFKQARKNDVWLHARGATGSHVIIQNPNQQSIPRNVLEYAASLAAQYSKLVRESVAPVIYTERKYVRKLKGGQPGQVLVDKEKVLMVEPFGS